MQKRDARVLNILNRLYHRRTEWLRSRLSKRKPGRPLTLSRKNRDKKISELRKIASEALKDKLAKKEFKQFQNDKRSWRVKGRGPAEKRRRFLKWCETLSHSRGKVYVFWSNQHCQYVGRTKGGGGRAAKRFERGWSRRTTRIDVYMIGRRDAVPRLECLAIHRFLPAKNKIRADRRKCPLCRVHIDIGREVRQIFNIH